MQVIPAIDLLNHRAVRLRKGRYDEVTEYDREPAEIAADFRRHARRLHVVDLDGARDGRARQSMTLRTVIAAFGDGVQVGGGLRTLDAIDEVFDLGASAAVLGTMAIRDPRLVEQATERHPGRVIVAIDARGGLVATDGWLETSETTAGDLLRALDGLDLGGVLYTDIERDGTEVGPNVGETAKLARSTRLPVIASGGVGTLDHLRALAAAGPIAAAIVGRALHEGRFGLEQAVAAARASAST